MKRAMAQKVSILVPVYCAEKHIAQCAESLFMQTYKDVEYVFVDDCTPDNSIDVLKEVVCKHPERQGAVKIIRNETNLGSGMTRDVALKASMGRYVMFVDSDDILPLDAVDVLHDTIQEKGADMAEGAFTTFGKEEQTTVPYVCRSKKEYIQLMLCRYHVANSLWAKMYLRNLFTDSGVTFISGIGDMEDYCLLARLAPYVKRRVTTKKVVYNYRLEGTSFFNKESITKRSISQLLAHKEVMKFYGQHDKNGEFKFALQLAMMSMIRSLREHNVSPSLMHQYCPYKPTGIFSLLSKLYASKLPPRISTFLYKLLRNVYFKWNALVSLHQTSSRFPESVN